MACLAIVRVNVEVQMICFPQKSGKTRKEISPRISVPSAVVTCITTIILYFMLLLSIIVDKIVKYW